MPLLTLEDLPVKTTLVRLLDQLGDVETDQLDFKRQMSRSLKDLIPAFAMTDGGLIVIGIAEDRTLFGCALNQNVADEVTRAAKAVGVDVQLHEIQVDDSSVVIVSVPEVRGRIVTTTDGRLLRRIGSDIHPLVGDQLARFVRERADVPGEEESVSAFGADSFDLDLVNRALQVAGRSKVDANGVGRALIDLDVAVPSLSPAAPKILVAAAVMFGRDPRSVVPGASVQLVRRTGAGPGPTPTQAREEVSGPLPALVDDAVAFITRYTRSFEVVIGKQRTVWPEYPVEVIREALLNALAHRDYHRHGTTVDVTIWDDRLEIRSPGGLPGPITVDNIREEHYSRNRRIMRALKMLGLVEEYGEGVDRMYEYMDARLMEPPSIVATSDSVTVTLRNRFLVSVEEQAWLSLVGNLQLSNAERLLLALTRREGSVTRRRIVRALPESNVDSLLRGATAKGLLVKLGQAGGVRYQLSEEVTMRAGSSGVEAQSRKRQTLLDEIHRRGSLSTAEGAELLTEEQSLVRSLLNDLVAAGSAIAKGQTRARRYYPA